MKMILMIAVLFVSLFAFGCTQNGPVAPRACTADAKICPDGSAVGRAGPNCEFAACPSGGNNTPPPGNSTTPIVCSCPNDQAPVCGADGKTYSNNCYAACLNVQVSHSGRCGFEIYPPACMGDAIRCPGGSYVFRAGLDCAFAACPQANYTLPPAPPANYTLYGKVTIGPLCPVEPCSRVFDYSVVRVNVYNATSKALVVQASAASSGYYGVKLGIGSYLVNVTDASGASFGLPRLDYTQAFTIEKGHLVQMDFDIDTGIR
ncbi:MAG: Kazal-type serine protease inhibitor family protein [Candidatus Micrarchaeia archaeon]|jgi:hypothetical protein